MLIEIALVACIAQHHSAGMGTNGLACFVEAGGRGGVVLPAEKQGWRRNGVELGEQVEIVESTDWGEFIRAPHGFIERRIAAGTFPQQYVAL